MAREAFDGGRAFVGGLWAPARGIGRSSLQRWATDTSEAAGRRSGRMKARHRSRGHVYVSGRVSLWATDGLGVRDTAIIAKAYVTECARALGVDAVTARAKNREGIGDEGRVWERLWP